MEREQPTPPAHPRLGRRKRLWTRTHMPRARTLWNTSFHYQTASGWWWGQSICGQEGSILRTPREEPGDCRPSQWCCRVYWHQSVTNLWYSSRCQRLWKNHQSTNASSGWLSEHRDQFYEHRKQPPEIFGKNKKVWKPAISLDSNILGLTTKDGRLGYLNNTILGKK